MDNKMSKAVVEAIKDRQLKDPGERYTKFLNMYLPGTNNFYDVNKDQNQNFEKIDGALETAQRMATDLFSKKQDKIDDSLQTTDKTVAGAINELNIRRVDTIEQLKASDVKVGDVLEILGYYSKDDGATHKRVISDSDDGSGVELDNGLWANILHNGDRVDVRYFGMIKEDISKAVLNKQILGKLFSKEFKLKLNDKFYIDASENTETELLNANIDMKGYSYNSELEFVNISKVCFFPTGDIKFIIEGVKLISNNTDENTTLFIFYISKARNNGYWNINTFEFNKNKVVGQMRVVYAEGHNDQNPATVTTRFNEINIKNNFFNNLGKGKAFSFYDTPFEVCNISNNRVVNFSNEVIYIGITNDAPFEKEFYRYLKKTFIRENDVFEEYDNIDVSEGGYHCFVLLEGDYVEVSNNKVEGVKSNKPSSTAVVYDYYLSCREVVFKNNIFKNIGCFNASVSGQGVDFMKCKQGSDTTEDGIRIYDNNIYILENEFVEKYATKHFSSLLTSLQGKFKDFIITNNVFNICKLQGTAQTNVMSLKNLIFENNILNIGVTNIYGNTPLFRIRLSPNNVNSKQIIRGNTFNTEDGALRVLSHSYDSTNYKATLVDVSNNDFNGKVGFLGSIVSKVTKVRGNTVNYDYISKVDKGIYYPLSFQSVDSDIGDLMYSDNLFYINKEVVSQLGNGLGLHTCSIENTYFEKLAYARYKGITFLKDSVENKKVVFYCRYKLYHPEGIEDFSFKFTFGYDGAKKENYLEVEKADGTFGKIYHSTISKSVKLKKHMKENSYDLSGVYISKVSGALILSIENNSRNFIRTEEKIDAIEEILV